MKENIKLLREKLRWWNREVIGWLDPRFEEVVCELNSLTNLFLVAKIGMMRQGLLGLRFKFQYGITFMLKRALIDKNKDRSGSKMEILTIYIST